MLPIFSSESTLRSTSKMALTQLARVYLAPPIAAHQVYGPFATLPLDCRLINLGSLLDGHAPVQIVADDPLAAPLPFAFDARRTHPQPYSALDAVRSGEADRVGLILLSRVSALSQRPRLRGGTGLCRVLIFLQKKGP